MIAYCFVSKLQLCELLPGQPSCLPFNLPGWMSSLRSRPTGFLNWLFSRPWFSFFTQCSLVHQPSLCGEASPHPALTALLPLPGGDLRKCGRSSHSKHPVEPALFTKATLSPGCHQLLSALLPGSLGGRGIKSAILSSSFLLQEAASCRGSAPA